MDGAVDGDGLLLGWGDELEVRPCPREVALRYGDSWALHIDCCGDPLSEDEELTEVDSLALFLRHVGRHLRGPPSCSPRLGGDGTGLSGAAAYMQQCMYSW